MRNHDPAKNTLYQSRWRQRHQEQYRQIMRERHDPERNRAYQAVYRALRRGDLIKGSCEVAVDCYGEIVAHHDDYAKPLDVRWLCRRHHAKLHSK